MPPTAHASFLTVRVTGESYALEKRVTRRILPKTVAYERADS
jgi:hypothetical protein